MMHDTDELKRQWDEAVSRKQQAHSVEEAARQWIEAAEDEAVRPGIGHRRLGRIVHRVLAGLTLAGVVLVGRALL